MCVFMNQNACAYDPAFAFVCDPKPGNKKGVWVTQFLRVWMTLTPCCALEAFQQHGAKLLPLPLPEFSQDEEQMENTLCQHISISGEIELGKDDGEILNKQVMKIGEKSWLWLQVFVLNFMYCQGVGSRMLPEGMPHSKKPTAAQEASLKKFSDFSKRRIEDEALDAIKAERWEKAAEELGDMHTGANVGKSYPLTLEAILPTTPGPGEAARIPLAEVVSDGVKPSVESPKDLRIPEEELVAPRTHAAVQVTSQEEWDKIAEHFVGAGMLEREVKEETVRHGDTEVRHGAFGVHKAWVLREDGSWLRTLRLIINIQ